MRQQSPKTFTSVSHKTNSGSIERLVKKKEEIIATIRFLHGKCRIPTEIHNEMKSVYGGNALSSSTVYYWHKLYDYGRINLSVKCPPSTGHPHSAKKRRQILNSSTASFVKKKKLKSMMLPNILTL